LPHPRRTLIVVEDSQPFRLWLLSVLQKRPELQVLCDVSHGVAAIKKAEELQPDLVLLDIGLPELNGIHAARQIRETSPKSKILFVTQETSEDVVQEALRNGGGGYLVKIDAASDLLPAVTAVLQGKRFVSRSIAGRGLIQAQDARLAPGGHVVQFYTDDSVLLDGLATFLGGSVSRGESVAAVTTSSHRRGLEGRLIAQGLDVSEATRDGRLVILDAHQALSQFMDAAGPSRERFLFQFGDSLRRLETAAAAKNKRLVVFGEMVAVLWAQKKHDAAIRLEELWNELAQTCSFYLCCAYPASSFREKNGGPYATICSQHSEVVSAF
jgi:DNA-binding NarL/FixJ family response regulator